MLKIDIETTFNGKISVLKHPEKTANAVQRLVGNSEKPTPLMFNNIAEFGKWLSTELKVK